MLPPFNGLRNVSTLSLFSALVVSAHVWPNSKSMHLLMDYESQTHPIKGNDLMPEPLSFKIPSMTKLRDRHILLFQLHPGVENSRMDVLFEWAGANEGKNWTTVMDPNGPSGLKCNFPRKSSQHSGKEFYTSDIVPRGLKRFVGGRSVYVAQCKMPPTVKARFKRSECVNVTITGPGVAAAREARGDKTAPYSMLSCPSSFQGKPKLATCLTTPLYGVVSFTAKLAQWLEYNLYIMKEDVHFIIYMHRHGTASLAQGVAMLKPYIDAEFVTLVWQSEYYTARHFDINNNAQIINANDCLYKAKNHATWIYNSADVDEFIAPHRFPGAGTSIATDEESAFSAEWIVPLEAGPEASGLMDLRAILDMADSAGAPKCSTRSNSCRVNQFVLAKCPAELPQFPDTALMKPNKVSESLLGISGKHITRVEGIAVYGIHSEVSFDEMVDWDVERVEQKLSSDPNHWLFRKHRTPNHLSNPIFGPGHNYPSSIVEYTLLHFNQREWDRWMKGVKTKGELEPDVPFKSSDYHVLDNVWVQIELRLASRFGLGHLFSGKIGQHTDRPWHKLNEE